MLSSLLRKFYIEIEENKEAKTSYGQEEGKVTSPIKNLGGFLKLSDLALGASKEN